MRLQKDVEQGAGVGMRDVQIVLAVGDKQRHVDISDDGKRVKLVVNEVLEELYGTSRCVSVSVIVRGQVLTSSDGKALQGLQ